VTVLFEASNAVTVTLKAVPAVSGVAAVTLKCVAVPVLTTIAPEVPVIDEVTVSVAVMVWLPAVFSVAVNVLVPLVSVLFAGSVAAPSLLVKCTVPA
jgi:hypothetical protein